MNPNQISLSRNLYLLLAILLLFSACREDERQIFDRKDQASGEIVFAARTIIISEEHNNEIQEIRQDGAEIVLNNPSGRLASVQAGDILAFSVTPHTPEGLLRKVISVKRDASNFVLITEQGLLTEAIESGNLKYQQRVGMAQIDEIILEEGVTFVGDSAGRMSGLGLNFELDKQLGDITLKGGLSINLTTAMDVDFGYFDVEKMQVEVILEEELELAIAANIDLLELKKEITLGKIRMTPIIIGWVVIVPEIELELDIEGKVYAGFVTSFHQTFNVKAGAIYENEAWAGIWEPQNQLLLKLFRPSVGMELKVELEPSIAYKFYGVIGPEFEALDIFAKFEADLGNNPCWEVYAGIEAEFEIKADIFDREFAHTIPFETFSIKIAEGECGGTGIITGVVLDAVSGVAISGVQLSVLGGGQNMGNTSTDINGAYTLELPAGDAYIINYAKGGYLTASRYNIEVFTALTTYVEAILQIDNQYQGNGDIGGQIKDAFTGGGVTGAAILVREGLGNVSGAVIASTTCDFSGYYSLADLPAGYYTGFASAPGYNPSNFRILSIGGQTTPNQDGTLNPVLPDSVVRVILTWGQTPSDLDSHLTGPDDSGGRFHVYYSEQTAFDGSANLDVDDVSSYGPETITITKFNEGVYRYSIHDYTNRGAASSNELSFSGAKVKVYQGNVEVADLNVPNQAGTLWTVFEIDNGNFNLINSMDYESDPTAVRSGQSDKALLRRLPPK